MFSNVLTVYTSGEVLMYSRIDRPLSNLHGERSFGLADALHTRQSSRDYLLVLACLISPEALICCPLSAVALIALLRRNICARAFGLADAFHLVRE